MFIIESIHLTSIESDLNHSIAILVYITGYDYTMHEAHLHPTSVIMIG